MALAAKDTAPRDPRHSGDLPTSTSAEGHSIIDPATGAVIDTVPEQGRDAVDAAVGKARAAFEHGEWPALVRSERARSLLRIADAVADASERLYKLETRNNGRPITETRAQLSRVPEWFRYNVGLLAAQRQACAARRWPVPDLSATFAARRVRHHHPVQPPPAYPRAQPVRCVPAAPGQE